MAIRIRQLGRDNAWQVQLDGEALVAAAAEDMATGPSDFPVHPTYQAALAEVAALPEPVLTAAAGDAGLLPIGWRSDAGIGFAEPTGDGRNFTGCAFTWRDPQESLLPLMLQTETDFGHFGAVLAGFIETLSVSGTAVHGAGRFYDTEEGRQFSTLLADGRRFGVSMDAGAVDVEFVCTEYDEEGWCIDGVANFLAYEIIGLTGTPFPAFARASIVSAGEPADEADATEDEAVAASAAPSALVRGEGRPPADWFRLPEPAIGEPFLDGLGDDVLVDQGNGALACPLTITEDGLLYGHLAYEGQCHVGFIDRCVSPPSSPSGYAGFMLGATICDDGTTVATGALTAGCDHAATTLRAPEARDHYAHNGVAWADVTIVDGVLGPWVCGALRPDVTRQQADLYRAGALSGDWRRQAGGLDLVSILAVVSPGFPVRRLDALAASAGASVVRLGRRAELTARQVNGEVETLVASGIVRRCVECAEAELAGQRVGRGTGKGVGDAGPAVLAVVQAMMAKLDRVERRTRHLVSAEAEATAARFRRD